MQFRSQVDQPYSGMANLTIGRYSSRAAVPMLSPFIRSSLTYALTFRQGARQIAQSVLIQTDRATARVIEQDSTRNKLLTGLLQLTLGVDYTRKVRVTIRDRGSVQVRHRVGARSSIRAELRVRVRVRVRGGQEVASGPSLSLMIGSGHVIQGNG